MNYGLALSGGGTRGAAHVGVLMALEEEGILPSAIAGTSAGSIAAGMFAAGISPLRMKEIVNYLSKYGLTYLDPNCIDIIRLLPQIFMRSPISLSGIIKGNRLKNYFCRITEGISISEVKIPTVIPAVDLNTGETIAFTNVEKPAKRQEVIWDQNITLCEAMIASSSVPGVFVPRNIKNYCLVDGGVTNNLPVDLLIAAGTKYVIAVDIGSDYKNPDNGTIGEVVSHSFSIMSNTLKECQSVGEILNLKPELPAKAGLLTFELMDECMEAGYLYTKRLMPAIKRSLRVAEGTMMPVWRAAAL